MSQDQSSAFNFICFVFIKRKLFLTLMRPLLLFILGALADEYPNYDDGDDYIIGGKAADVNHLSFVVFFDFMVRKLKI